MFKSILYGTAIMALVAGAGISGAHAETRDCLPIGGLGMANFVPQSDGTITIVAPLTGSVRTASGKVTAQRTTATGLEMDMEHYFMTEEGGFMHTKDLGILSSVTDRKDRYMVEITYTVQDATTSGPLKGYKGTFKSFGLIDLANLKGLIRYSGEICK